MELKVWVREFSFLEIFFYFLIKAEQKTDSFLFPLWFFAWVLRL